MATAGAAALGGQPATGGRAGAAGNAAGGVAGSGTGSLVIYPEPSGLDGLSNLARSPLYAVTVDGKPTFVYRSTNRRPENSVIDAAHIAYFSFANRSVTVQVTLLSGTVASAKVRPNSLGLTAALSGNSFTFTLDSPPSCWCRSMATLSPCCCSQMPRMWTFPPVLASCASGLESTTSVVTTI